MITFQNLIDFCKPISVTGSEPGIIGKLCSDSRKVRTGDIFIAVKGLTVDGYEYIDQAISNGASIIIAERAVELRDGISVLVVEDTRSLLGPLAQFMNGDPAKKLKIIGVTGTNGKTTVATLIWQVLTSLDHKASLLGTVEKRINKEKFESSLTTADPIELAEDMRAMTAAGSQYLVMEVSSHALHQQRVNGIPFEVAVFTNLSHDHLDYHTTIEEYASAKKQLFDSLGKYNWAVTNVDDEWGEWMVKDTSARTLSFSLTKEALISGRILVTGANGTAFLLEETKVETPLIGRFNAYNAAEAVISCTALGFDGAIIIQKLKECKGAPGRMEKVRHSDAEKAAHHPVVIIDYAHTPDALENVCSTLNDLKVNGQTFTVVFGCGGDRDKSKRPEMAKISERYADRIMVTSDNPRSEKPEEIIGDILDGFNVTRNVQQITDRKKAIRKVIKEAESDSIILIAGKGHETYQEVNGTRHHFDDREVALEALELRNDNSKRNEIF